MKNISLEVKQKCVVRSMTSFRPILLRKYHKNFVYGLFLYLHLYPQQLINKTKISVLESLVFK